jgi:glutaredoxin 2
MADYVKFFFELSNNTKLYHWMTTSFARHKASDKLFDSIIDLSDKFMETYMGRYGRPSTINDRTAKLNVKTYTDKSIIEYYNSCKAYLESSFAKQLKPTDTDLLNIRDELLGSINQVLYLFTLA